MSRSLLIGLAAFAALTLSAAEIASVFTARSLRIWYPALRKPPGNPPASYFGPACKLLYVSMVFSAWNVWRVGDGWEGATQAVSIFLIQLALNAAWSAIFFGMRAPGLALLEIAFLWIAILMNVVVFWKISPLSGAFLIPDLLWVSYTAYLNAGIWWLM